MNNDEDLSNEPLLLSLFLERDFWNKNKDVLGESYFTGESLKIYKTISNAYIKYGEEKTVLTIPEVEALLRLNNPMMTPAQLGPHMSLLQQLNTSISPAIAQDVVQAAFRQYIGDSIAQAGLDLSEGKPTVNLDDIRNMIDQYEGGVLAATTKGLEVLDTDFDVILAADEKSYPWKFNLAALDRLIPGIGPGHFGIVFASVETGKSAFSVSTSFGPGGFAEQGARVLCVANEEPASKHRTRALVCYAGKPVEDLRKDPEQARYLWERIKDNVLLSDTNSFNDLEGLVKRFQPDIVIIDQLDKMNISGVFAREDLKLSEIYRRSREIAKNSNCSVIAVTQADSTAAGRTNLHFSQMSGAKVGKPAEADWIAGIGKEVSPSGEDNLRRYITVSKNKLGGPHGKCTVMIAPELSRYHD
jgi:replicative DNA helicase